LKWRVQPQTSFLTTKKSILEMLFLFFLHFICSSSSVHHVCFVYRLQLTLKNTCIWDFPFICPFLLWISFFLGLSRLTGIFLDFFYQDLLVFLLYLIFQCKCLKWRLQPQCFFLSSQRTSLELLFLFFLHFKRSSSSFHHVFFLYRLQLTLKKSWIWDLPFICPFLLWISLFFCFWT